MVENALVTNRLLKTGDLIRELDKRGLNPTFAAWYFYEDSQSWRLLIASPAFDTLLSAPGNTAFLKLIDAANAVDFGVDLTSDVSLVKTDTPLIDSLRLLVRTSPDEIATSHYSNAFLNGLYIAEVFILRSTY